MRGIEMDHNEALRQKATEKYLLNELDPDLRDQFEEHLFDCQDCALDLRAAAMFVEQSKIVLAESPVASAVPVRAAQPAKSAGGWFAWLRPAFAVPVMALLLAVIGYQNLVTYPKLMQAMNEPQVAPWASVNISTRGPGTTEIKTRPGVGFSLIVNVPPDQTYSSYNFELYNPAGKLQWASRSPATSPDEALSIYIPGTGLEQGNYTLAVIGVTASGQSSKISSNPIEVQIQR
jgi:Putative zinc-finger